MVVAAASKLVMAPSSRIKAFARYPGVYLLLDGAHARWAFTTLGGLEILSLCDGTRTEAEIADVLAPRWGVSLAEAESQTSASLAAMLNHELVNDYGVQPKEIIRPQTRFSGLTVEITRRCNLRCRHCYLGAAEASPGELTTAELKDLIWQAREVGASFTNLSGGEPLLREDCFELLEQIADLGLESIIGTNATLITPEVAGRLAGLPGLVQVSLDGTSTETHDAVRGPGAFRRTMRGLDNLERAGMAGRVTLAFTAMACNVNDAATIIDLALARGFRGVVFTSLLAGGNARENWDDLKLSGDQAFALWELISTRAREFSGKLPILHQGVYLSLTEPGVSKVLCSIGTNLRIDSVGDVYPCQCFVSGTDYRLGNVRQRPLAQLVHGTRLQEIKMARYERIEAIDECHKCDWRHYCGAGCMGNAYHKEGTILATPDCDIRRRWVQRLFELQLARCVE